MENILQLLGPNWEERAKDPYNSTTILPQPQQPYHLPPQGDAIVRETLARIEIKLNRLLTVLDPPNPPPQP